METYNAKIEETKDGKKHLTIFAKTEKIVYDDGRVDIIVKVPTLNLKQFNPIGGDS